jgi:osmoprotectant transport system permease protein
VAAPAAIGTALRLGLAALALAALGLLPWLGYAPNRLLPGEPVPAWRAMGMTAPLLAALLVGAGLLLPRRAAAAAVRPALTLAALLLLAGATGLGAARLIEGQPPAARAMLGGGAWVAGTALTLLAAEQARELPRRVRALLALAALAGLLGLALGGAFDALSLAAEYRARQQAVHAAIGRHLVMSAAALGLALLLALPAGLAGFASARAATLTEAALGAVQVVPALALFGLLVPLLSLLLAALPALRAAGLAAIGATPALIGVALYLALPLARAIRVGLAAADPAAVEAARAMGMAAPRIALEVRLPLGLPVFAAGLRVALVQAVGLVTLGGLIGAGGLGALVFEGMAQLAADLILLGALPVIALALAADALMARAEAAVTAAVAGSPPPTPLPRAA